MNDERFMGIAIEASKEGDWPYGAILVKDGTRDRRQGIQHRDA